MRLLGERLLSGGQRSYGAPYTQIAFMQGEIEQRLLQRKPKLPPPRDDCEFHLYCSPHVPDTTHIIKELSLLVPDLKWTDDARALGRCERIVVHLTIC